MNTARPAAGAALAFFQLRNGARDMLLARLKFLDRNTPADPFVARKRRQALPCRPRFLVSTKNPLQICGQNVRCVAGNLFGKGELCHAMCYNGSMTKPLALTICIVILVVVIVGIDVLFFKNRFWERLLVNIGVVLVFAALYLRFLG